MDSSDIILIISILASTIAKNKTKNEIELLAAFFSQLGSTLANILLLDDSQNQDVLFQNIINLINSPKHGKIYSF